MLITAAVFAAATGHLSIAGVIAAAIIGAVLGDNIGFGIGWFGGYPLLRRFGKYVRLDEAKLKVGGTSSCAMAPRSSSSAGSSRCCEPTQPSWPAPTGCTGHAS